MNLYFLLEGRRSEPQIYAAWLPIVAPIFRRVPRYDLVTRNSYFLFTADGYPGILTKHLPNAVRDVNAVGKYDFLVVVLDADEASVDERHSEIVKALSETPLKGTELVMIVQNRCLESWLLGNRRIIARTPEDPILQKYVDFYDVSSLDPELMPCHPDFRTHSQFHHAYLRRAFAAKEITYSKRNPGHACEPTYIQQLINRLKREPAQLHSLRRLLSFLTTVSTPLSTDVSDVSR